MKKNSVLLSYLCQHQVSQSFMDSVCNTFFYEKDRGTNGLWRTFPVYSGPLTLAKSRNKIVEIFLTQSECEWLFMVDSDMGFKPDTLATMVKTAETNQLQMLSGLYHGVFLKDSDGMGGWNYDVRPLVFLYNNDQRTFEQLADTEDLPKDTLMGVDGTGGGALLLHRDLLVEMQEKYGSEWFTHIEEISEDLSFCLRIRTMGKPVTVHTGIKFAHHKSTWLGA
jgi:hypothetical protein